MKQFTWLVTIVVLVALAATVMAGPKEAQKAEQAIKVAKSSEKCTKKCEADVQTCLNNLYAKLSTKGWLGIEMDQKKGESLYTIIRVVPESPAETAGFQVGDMFAGINGVLLGDATKEEQKKAKLASRPGAEVTYVVLRDGEKTELTATLAKVPHDVMARWIGDHMLEHVQHEDLASLDQD